MRAHFFQHVVFEGLGNIEPWLIARGYEITATKFYKKAELPDPDAIELLIIMGGPMNVNDEGQYPWLVAEKRFIRECIRAGKPVLGICLGSQLIASALGARVYRNHENEIGWFPVHGIPAPDPSVFQFPASVEVFHWHGDTFDLPQGAIHLARSEACENQAFLIGKSVIGLQFHPETTDGSLREMISHSGKELKPAKYIQSEKVILGVQQEKYQVLNNLMGEVLAFLTG